MHKKYILELSESEFFIVQALIEQLAKETIGDGKKLQFGVVARLSIGEQVDVQKLNKKLLRPRIEIDRITQ